MQNLALDANNDQVLGESLLSGTVSCPGLVMDTRRLVGTLAYVDIGSDSFCLGWLDLSRESRSSRLMTVMMALW